MLKNYFKLAIKVLGRRKFFTFISLFGISFTLMVLMVATALFDSELGKNAPLSKKDQMIFASMITLSREFQDTTLIIDTTYVDNVVNYDTSYNFKPAGRSMSRSNLSYHFLDTHLSDIPFVERQSFYQKNVSFDVFIKGRKINFATILCDADFWNIYDFNFIDGKPFRAPQVENQEQVAVISRQASTDYFGTTEGVIGKEVIIEGKHYQVIGLVESGIASMQQVNAEVYLPVTHAPPKDLKGPGYMGGFEGVYLAANRKNAIKVKNEINQKESRIPQPSDSGNDYNQLDVEVMTFNERYASNIMPTDDPEWNLRILFSIVAFFTILFFLLPTLNLININVSRIMERSSEIGVRKAFGASSQTILLQFVFENIVLTLLGGLIGFVLALLVIYVINDSQVLEDTILNFNFKVFLYSLVICLFFGIVSGIIPAWRMSRIHIVNALKQNQL